MVSKYDPKEVEKEVLEFWEKNEIYEKAKEIVKKGKEFYFLDGPPYVSGKVHLGTAWNKALKDTFLRYKRKRGFNVFDRAGYDMHGLPIEHATEKELGLKDKKDIEEFGIENFIKACRELAIRNMKIMNNDFKRLGVWMDFTNAYQTISRDFMLGEWWLIKKAHEKGRLYEDYKTMHWCAHCGTALAKHELEYKNVKDNSIFVKFKLKGKENEFLLVWTTTPWTLPFNLGVMVNPEMEYVKIEVEHNERKEKWIIAKALVNSVVGGVLGKRYKLIEELKGKDMEGWEYEPIIETEPLKEAVKNSRKPENAFTILLSEEYVTPTAGTGLVHCAPGCGPEDYEVGHRYGLPAFNNIDEHGYFPSNMDWLAGFKAKYDDEKIINFLKEKGFLLSVQPVDHDYAHCWRCHKPVIFRTTKQWFFKIEDLKDKLLEFNSKVKWVPDWSGSRQFASWLENLRDNTITRQRYWGTPVPIWRCTNEKCAHYEVISSDEDAEKLGGKLPEDLHKPEIDKVILKCPKCGSDMKRIPDVLDVWIDAGTTSWNALDYPNREDLFQKLYPPEFILEGKDQIRGWFNLLMICSIIAFDKPGFRACYMHGFINDAKGRKMSKSLGNYITPEEVVDVYGADTLRLYFVGGANPGLDLNYNEKDTKLRHRNLNILWNLHNYILDLKKSYNIIPKSIEEIREKLTKVDKFIISKTERTIEEVTKDLEGYRISDVPKKLEEAFLSLSRDYIQMVRSRVSEGEENEKVVVLSVLMHCYTKIINALSIVVPFITEKIYLDLKEVFGEKIFNKESIHLEPWPEVKNNLIDEEIESEIENTLKLVSAINEAREKAGIKRRWPLKKVVVIPKGKYDKDLLEEVGNVKEVKEIRIEDISIKVKEKEGVESVFRSIDIDQVKLNENNYKLQVLSGVIKKGDKVVEIDQSLINVEVEDIEKPFWGSSQSGIAIIEGKIDDEVMKEGLKRDIIRNIQDVRKKLGLVKTQRISLVIGCEGILHEIIEKNKEEIIEKCGIKSLELKVPPLDALVDEKEKKDKLFKKKIGDQTIEFFVSSL